MRHDNAGGWCGEVVTNDALRFRKVIEFESSLTNLILLYLSNHRWKKIIN